MMEAMSLRKDIEDLRTQEMLKPRQYIKQSKEISDEQYEALFAGQGFTKVKRR